MKQDQFSDFVRRIRDRYGSEAEAVRHEIYFLSRRGGRVACSLLAVGALLRDLLTLLRLPARGAAQGEIIGVVTLAGASGWGTLEPALRRAAAAGFRTRVVIHPRLAGTLDLPERDLPPRPRLRDVVAAFGTGLQLLRRRFTDPDIVVVAATVIRGQLWRHCWRRLLTPGWRALLCHNDFDMFSAAAVDAARHRVPSICIQHGLPTDEFFPTRADHYVVWGESSAKAFRDRGTPAASLVIDGFGRDAAPPIRRDIGTDICILSQTHTPIYGIDLREKFVGVAHVLSGRFPDRRLRVLLHPEEVRRGHPYAAVPGLSLEAPPHELLRSAAPPLVVVGFSTTALIDAARAGHYVVGLDWTPLQSTGAHGIASPRCRAAGDADLERIIGDLLTSDVARDRHAAAQQAWLQATFSASTREDDAPFIQLLRSVGCGTPS